jgi:hypothetical protein
MSKKEQLDQQLAEGARTSALSIAIRLTPKNNSVGTDSGDYNYGGTFQNAESLIAEAKKILNYIKNG